MRRRVVIVAAWALLAGLAAPFAAHVTRGLTAGGFEAPHSTARWADDQLARLKAPPEAEPYLLTGVDWKATVSQAAALAVPTSWLHRLPGRDVALVPPTGTAPRRVALFLAAIRSSGGHATPVDDTQIADALSRASEDTLKTASAAALPVLLVLLLVVYGSLAAAALPLVVALLGSELTLAVVDLLESRLTLSIYLTDIVTFLALGVGVDYALFIGSRFRQALSRGRTVPEALAEAMATAGRSVFFSGLAVALAVGTLALGATAYWTGLAIGGAVAVAAVLLCTHTLLPALLSFLGRRIEWGRLPWYGSRGTFWRRLSDAVARRPALALAGGLIPLLVPALFAPAFAMRIPADLATMLPPSDPLRRASAVVQQVRGKGSVAPLAVVVRLPTTADDPRSWATVMALAEKARRLDGVAAVASPASLGLSPPALAELAANPDLDPAAARLLQAFSAPRSAPHLFAFSVEGRMDPNSAAARRLARRLGRLVAGAVPPGTKAAVGGTVPLLEGFDRFTAERLPLIVGAVAFVAAAVLFLATGSLTQALLGVLLDALVALATAGFLVLTVERGAFGLEAEPLNTAVTPLIFVLLFGLSMDYEVILLHRVQEALREAPTTAEAVRRGSAVTGAMITGAGLIMVVVFVVLLTSRLEILKTLGIGMTVAILMDTWFVRTFLVPALTVLLGRAAFWPGRPRLGHP